MITFWNSSLFGAWCRGAYAKISNKDSIADSKCNKIYYLVVRGNVESGRLEDRRAKNGAGDKMAGVLDGEREVSVCAKQIVSWCRRSENSLTVSRWTGGEAESNWLEVWNRRDGGWAGWVEVDMEGSMMKVGSR